MIAAFGNPVVPLVYMYNNVSLGLAGSTSVKFSLDISFNSADKFIVSGNTVVDPLSGELYWNSGKSGISCCIVLIAEIQIAVFINNLKPNVLNTPYPIKTLPFPTFRRILDVLSGVTQRRILTRYQSDKITFTVAQYNM